MTKFMDGCRAVLLPLALLYAMAGAAAAAERTISGPEMVKILHDEGYQAKLSTDSDGDPQIESRMSGVTVYVRFYDCEQMRCGSLQLSVGLDLEKGSTMAVVNAFNREFRYARAYLDDEMDPYLKFDLELLHVDHAAYVASQIGIWEKLLGEFTLATGFRGAEPVASPDATPATSGRTTFGALAR